MATVTSPRRPVSPGETSARKGKKAANDAHAPRRRVTVQESPEQRMRFVVYEDNNRRWRWRLVSNRGHVLAESNKDYGRHQMAIDAAESIRESAGGARLQVQA